MIEAFLGTITLLLLILIALSLREKSVTVIAPEVKERIVPAISQFDPNSPVTTVSPAPFASQACSHDWEIVTEQVLEVEHETRLVVIMKCNKCGLVDKTMSVTSAPPKPPPPPPVPPLPRCECRHRWEKEKNVTLDSAYEQMSKVKGGNGQWKKDSKTPELDQKKLEPWMFRKVYISVRVCTQCGEVDKSIVSNLEDETDEPEGEQ